MFYKFMKESSNNKLSNIVMNHDKVIICYYPKSALSDIWEASLKRSVDSTYTIIVQYIEEALINEVYPQIHYYYKQDNVFSICGFINISHLLCRIRQKSIKYLNS